MKAVLKNPFKPGAGLDPPYLAGREDEKKDFENLIEQSPVIKNLVITGLRGIGKTVLLNSLKPLAIGQGWFWAENDLSESVSVSEMNLSTRIITDISVIVAGFTYIEQETTQVGYVAGAEKREVKLTYHTLMEIYNATPGLNSDKLKKVLEIVWATVGHKAKGIVLAYDEAQNLTDQAPTGEYPLSLLLEVTQYLQKKEIPYLLILSGLPVLFPSLVETRTYSERMFHVMTLTKLSEAECRQAIEEPIKSVGEDNCPITFTDSGINQIIKFSGGYPFFIQFFCKESFDSIIQQQRAGVEEPIVTITEIIKKLDNDFYSARWMKVTDRQKELLLIISKLPNSNKDFTAQDVLSQPNDFGSASNLNQILTQLISKGFLYKENHGKYMFAVPMLADFINRQMAEN